MGDTNGLLLNKRMNLAIVGGQKCGTTALAHFLSQHPDIFVVNGKEAHIFDLPEVSSLTHEQIDNRYQVVMAGFGGERWLCDATPIYAYWKEIPRRLVAYNPGIKVIFLVRDPVDRAVSHYLMEKNRGDEPYGILRAFVAEQERLARDYGNTEWSSSWRHHSYLDRGLYTEQISNLRNYLSHENILILANWQLVEDHHAVLNTVFRFLDIAPISIPSEQVFRSTSSTLKGLPVWLARCYAGWKLKQERYRLKNLNVSLNQEK